MGTPEFAVPALTEIIEEGHLVAAVYTRAPQPGGRRGLEPTPSPVHAAALRFGIEVVTPPKLRSEEAAAALRAFKPDVVVVAAYGLILPKAILDVPASRAVSICTPRCCRDGAARRRSSAPSWRATARPASW